MAEQIRFDIKASGIKENIQKAIRYLDNQKRKIQGHLLQFNEIVIKDVLSERTKEILIRSDIRVGKKMNEMIDGWVVKKEGDNKNIQIKIRHKWETSRAVFKKKTEKTGNVFEVPKKLIYHTMDTGREGFENPTRTWSKSKWLRWFDKSGRKHFYNKGGPSKKTRRPLKIKAWPGIGFVKYSIDGVEAIIEKIRNRIKI